MRRSALSLLFLAACTSTEDAGEHLARVLQAFTSGQALLLDFELEGELVADTDDVTLRTAILDQLRFTIGHLNAEWLSAAGSSCRRSSRRALLARSAAT